MTDGCFALVLEQKSNVFLPFACACSGNRRTSKGRRCWRVRVLEIDVLLRGGVAGGTNDGGDGSDSWGTSEGDGDTMAPGGVQMLPV